MKVVNRRRATVKDTHLNSSTTEYRNLTVLIRWLWVVFGAITLMVIVGGVTRLTGSGLSMVEWRPLMGTLPPLSTTEWNRVFELYKASPQYLQVNHWMTLADFKSIFFWEYVHRFFGRMIGLIFFLPMVWFWLRGQLSGEHRWRALGALILGGCQGLLGWYMVKSGLIDEPAVSHFRLAAHLSMAFFLGVYIIDWLFTLKIQRQPRDDLSKPENGFIKALLAFAVCLTIQIVYGAFLAGTRAGYMYQSFPLLNGSLITPAMAAADDGLALLFQHRDFFNLFHRILAIALGLAGIGLFIWGRRKPGYSVPTQRSLNLFVGLLLTQVLLGILTAFFRIPTPLGALHQVVAFWLLASLIWALRSFGWRSPS